MSSLYHFIIVGGGTAGLCLAARLSEDPSFRVLVLEAGTDHSDDPRVKTPALYQTLMKSDVDWAFESEPQAKLNGRHIPLHQGKALGGSSATNAHIFVLPTWNLVDKWESVLGNEGWNRETIQRSLLKTFTLPSMTSSSGKILGIDSWPSEFDSQLSPSGPISLSYSGDLHHPIREAWSDTFKRNGQCMQENQLVAPKGNGESAVGSFNCLSSVDPVTKERNDAASAYYHPAKGRPNLHVMTGVTVERVIFDDSNPQYPVVCGVQYLHDCERRTVTAIKEVIICAGALQSPKILELSGIGNHEILSQYGIQTIKDIPAVGENLQDHLICGIWYEAQDSLDTLDDLLRGDPLMIQKAMEEYAINRSGPLTSIGMHTYAYLPISSDSGRQAVDAVLRSNEPTVGDSPEASRSRAYYEIVKESMADQGNPSGTYLSVVAQQNLPVDPDSDSLGGPVPGKFLTLGLILPHPLSRGSVHIRSKDPSAAPTIDPKYFSNPVDAEVMAQHMLHLDVIAKSPPLSGLLKTPLTRRDPASQLSDAKTAKKYLENSAISMFHYVGTCAMLPESMGGVVDNELRVHGVRGLRVVDSSVIPLITTGNTQSMVYAVVERAAELIKTEYQLN